jgi:[ribosomal protein S5]-alanine N-acetyltransferase
MFELETRRLLLRDFIDSDWQIILSLSSEPRVTRWQDYLPEASEARCREWVSEFIVHNSERPRFAYNLSIILLSTGEKIGWVGWGHASDKRIGDRDFGYAIVPAHWNKGYMTEAMVAVLAYIFAEDDANSVFGECDALNHGSSGVMKKAGMHLVREWEEERADGRTYPMHRYLISRSQRVGR